MPITATNPLKGRHFPGEVILLCVGWYLPYPLAYEHVSELLAERGVAVDPSCIWRWVQAHAPELNKRYRPHLKPTNKSYRTDETCAGGYCVGTALIDSGAEVDSMALLTGARILLAVRDRAATNFESLCCELACNTSTDRMVLRDKLKQLRDLGLMAFTGPAERSTGIEIAERWTQIQVALGGESLRLQDIADLDLRETMVVRPFFKPPHSAGTLDVFVLMPFSQELRPIYTDHIKPVAERLGLQSRRADDFFAPHAIMMDIWAAINQARIVVADCTERNANVFYEIGLAHVVNKPVVLITQKEADVPFDLRHLRYVKYAYTPPGMKELETKLEQAFKDLGSETRGAV